MICNKFYNNVTFKSVALVCRTVCLSCIAILFDQIPDSVTPQKYDKQFITRGGSIGVFGALRSKIAANTPIPHRPRIARIATN